MTENWPPEGYSTSREYQTNEYYATFLMVVFGVAPIFYLWGTVSDGVSQFISSSVAISQSLNLGLPRLFIRFTSGVFVIAILWGLWKLIVVPFHERIHFEVSKKFGNNPEFGYHDAVLMQNPGVTPMTTGISRWETFWSLVSPFLLINSFALLGILTFQGFLATVFVFVLATNSGGSGSDLYHVGRLLLFPKGTLYANFHQEGGIRTEYAVPE